MIELVDFNEIYGKGKGEAKEAGKRTRRSGSKKKAAEKTEAAPAAKEDSKEEKSAE
jgi:large subunit ribosomal protein L17